MVRNGLRYLDVPAAYEPRKTICNRFVHCKPAGHNQTLLRRFPGNAGGAHVDDATQTGPPPACSDRGRSRMSRAHQGWPLIVIPTEGQVRDIKGAASMLNIRTRAKVARGLGI